MKRLVLGMIILGNLPILAQDSIICFKKAYSRNGLDLSTQNAIELCAGAVDLNPATCFKEANSSSGLNLSIHNSIKLCAGAINRNSIICFEKAYSSNGLNLSIQNAIKLCKSNRVQR